MCAGLYDVYQGEGTEQKLQELSEGTTPVSEYMRKGFDFLQMMIDKGYMDPEKALDTIPSSDGEKEFFAQENCAFICAIYRGKTFEGYPFEIEMTPLPLLENGSICVVGADQRLAINPNAKHLEAAITVVEALGQTEILDAFAQNLGKISSSKMPRLLPSPSPIQSYHVLSRAVRYQTRISACILMCGIRCGI